MENEDATIRLADAMKVGDLDTMRRELVGFEKHQSSSVYHAWAQNCHDQALQDHTLVAGLDLLKTILGPPPINQSSVCRELLRRNHPLTVKWAKQNNLSLDSNTYSPWLSGCLARIDTLDPTGEMGWVVARGKEDDFNGALVALAILGGHPVQTLNLICKQLQFNKPRDIAKGICSLMYRQFDAGLLSVFSPTDESLAWLGARCDSSCFKVVSQALMIDEESLNTVINPFVARVQAVLEAHRLDVNTIGTITANKRHRL